MAINPVDGSMDKMDESELSKERTTLAKNKLREMLADKIQKSIDKYLIEGWKEEDKKLRYCIADSIIPAIRQELIKELEGMKKVIRN